MTDATITPILTGRQLRRSVEQEFEYQQRQAKANGWAVKCDGKYAEFSDYVVPPTVAEAEALCEGCPLVKAGNLCLEFATRTKADHGIWGGTRFVDGKPITATIERRLAA